MTALTSVQGSPYQQNMDSVKLQMEVLDKIAEQLKGSQEGQLTPKEMLELGLQGRKEGLTLKKGEDGNLTWEPLSGDSLQSSIKLTGAASTDMSYARDVLTTAEDAINKYSSKYTGLWDSLLGSGRIATNAKGAGDETQFRQNISSVQTAVRKYISGAAITPEEGKYLKDLIPKVTDSDDQIQAKLQGLREWSYRKGQSLLDTAGYKVDAKSYMSSSGKNKEEQVSSNKIGRFTVEVE
jgi:hypothetical protein